MLRLLILELFIDRPRSGKGTPLRKVVHDDLITMSDQYLTEYPDEEGRYDDYGLFLDVIEDKNRTFDIAVPVPLDNGVNFDPVRVF